MFFERTAFNRFAERCFLKEWLQTDLRSGVLRKKGFKQICGAVFFERTASNRFAERCSLKERLQTDLRSGVLRKNGIQPICGAVFFGRMSLNNLRICEGFRPGMFPKPVKSNNLRNPFYRSTKPRRFPRPSGLPVEQSQPQTGQC